MVVIAPDLGLRAAGNARRVLACEDGSELGYWTVGSAGPAIVCVNAHGHDLLVFSSLVELLARRHRVIAWKPRGTFEDRRPAHTLFDQVRDLERIVKREGLAECSLVTWCAGAKVAIEFARRNALARSLVLTSGTFTRVPGLERLETPFEKTMEELCRTVVKKPMLASMMMNAMRSLLGVSAGQEESALSSLVAEPFQSPATTLRYAAQCVDYLAHDISPALIELEIPALVVSGQNDRT